jgi:hypothetical protein
MKVVAEYCICETIRTSIDQQLLTLWVENNLAQELHPKLIKKNPSHSVL